MIDMEDIKRVDKNRKRHKYNTQYQSKAYALDDEFFQIISPLLFCSKNPTQSSSASQFPLLFCDKAYAVFRTSCSLTATYIRFAFLSKSPTQSSSASQFPLCFNDSDSGLSPFFLIIDSVSHAAAYIPASMYVCACMETGLLELKIYELLMSAAV
jgi:hypothetical protein